MEVGVSGPGCLQEHSVVAHNNRLYVFGGEISFSNAAETPLWIYDIQVFIIFPQWGIYFYIKQKNCAKMTFALFFLIGILSEGEDSRGAVSI